MYEEGSCSKSSFYVNDNFTNKEIHVLLVHTDQEISKCMCNQLEVLPIKVAIYQCAQDALSLATAGNMEFDLMLVNADVADSIDPFTALGFATAINLPTILISSKSYDYDLAKRALKNGALNYLTLPISEETARYCLWYPIMQKKVNDGKKINQKSIYSRSTDMARKNISDKKDGPETLNKRRKYTKKCNQELKWTDELRQKFWDAVNQLDDGCCVPTKILEMMNVPGLTTRQVSSYLQKCRHEIKRLTSAAAQPESSGNSVTKRRNLPACGVKPIIPNVGVNIRSNNRSRYTRLIYPQQPSTEAPHFRGDRPLMNASVTVTDPVGSDAPENSSAREKQAPSNFFTFLPLREDDQ